MIEINTEFKQKVLAALAIDRKNYDGVNAKFANRHKINPAIYSRIKNGEIEGVLSDQKWIEIGCRLGVTINDRKWNIVKTDVFTTIEQQVDFCQKHSKALIYVDDCGTGKTVATTYLSLNRPNCFRVDASQAKDTIDFIKALAQAIGVTPKGKKSEIKAEIKYYLRTLPNPVVIIDEAGDINPATVMEIKELWNATEKTCGWFLCGAEAFRVFIDRGVKNNRPGFAELFSRFGDSYGKTVPNGKDDKMNFYKKLITDVLSENVTDQNQIPSILKKCLTEGDNGKIGGLRRAESLLLLHTSN